MKATANTWLRIATLGVLSLAVLTAQAADVHVNDYGAIPDDGQCDTLAIRAAIAAAKNGVPRIVRFDAGVYNMDESNAIGNAHLLIDGANALTLIGAIDAQGEPATILQRNVAQMQNDMDVAYQIRINDSYNITIQNLAFDNQPAFTSAGVVVAVDEELDTVEVEVFEGLPHFEGMQCYSANAWDLQTRDLKNVEALTIGTDQSTFVNTWHAVDPNNHPRRYQLQGYGFTDRIHVGDGMSWHFTVLSSGTFSAIWTTNLTLDNVHFYNLKGAMYFRFNTNITLCDVEVKPIEPQLAVGSRDAFYLLQNAGDLLVEDCYVKGVRWDPFNVRNSFATVTSIDGPRTFQCTLRLGSTLATLSDAATFYCGDAPTEVGIAQATKTGSEDGDYFFTVELTDDLPAAVEVGTRFVAHNLNFDQATFRRCTFEGNCGRPILYQNENLLLEDCLFRNNSYASLALGPVGTVEGGFVRNAVIRNNTFADSTWDSTTPGEPYNGTVKIYQSAGVGDAAYNTNILLQNNHFSGINYVANYSAIDIKNAQSVTLCNNTFEDCANNVRIDPDSTLNIDQDNGDVVVADFNDMNLGAMRVGDGQPAGTGVGFAEDYWGANTSWVRVVEGDLTAPASTGYNVVSSGNPQCVQGLYPPDDRRQARHVIPVAGNLSRDIWISFLAKNVEATDVAGIDFMATYNTNVDPPVTLRKIILAGNTLKVVSSGSGGGEVDVSSKVTLGETALVLAKLTTGGLNDPEQLEVWIDPNVTNGEAGLPTPDFEQSGDLEWDMDGIDWLGLQSWDTGSSGVGGFVDNIRISNSGCGFDFVVESELTSGCNSEYALDWMDYLEYENCQAGPGGGSTNGCVCADLNYDTDVDLLDLDILQRRFMGDL